MVNLMVVMVDGRKVVTIFWNDLLSMLIPNIGRFDLDDASFDTWS